jgi:hypothetical protein
VRTIGSQPNPGDKLRQCYLQKGQIASYQPRSTLPANLHPGPEAHAFIHCCATGRSVYSPSANTFLEMKNTDAALASLSPKGAPQMMLNPSSLASTGRKKCMRISGAETIRSQWALLRPFDVHWFRRKTRAVRPPSEASSAGCEDRVAISLWSAALAIQRAGLLFPGLS